MVTAARFLGPAGTSLATMIGRLALAALPILGCTQGAAGTAGEAPPPASAAAPPAPRGAVVITQIVTHDAKVSILSGGGDLRVVVRKMDGAMVADGITLSELALREPELYEVVTSAFASTSTDGQRRYLDATLGPRN